MTASPACPTRVPRPAGRPLAPSQLDQHDVGLRVHALADQLAPVGRDVEVAYLELRRQVGERLLGSGLEVDEPEILVIDWPALPPSSGRLGRLG